MIKRTIEVSSEPAHLTVKLDQLLVQRHGLETAASIPCEDIGMLVVDQPQSTYSHAALAALVRFDAVLVVCGNDHLPAGVLLPLADHSQVVWRVAEQVAVSKPLRKQLWKQLVRAKIRAQALNLPADCPARKKLLELAQKVRSGDPSNVEAHAAQVYWQHWLPGEPFRRDEDGAGLNALLNYGYAILRAAVARALVAAGLLPAIGLFHANRSNAFCLADDLMEPFRPLVDRRVRELHRQGHAELNPQTKAGLLGLLADRVRLGHERGPLMVNLHRMVALAGAMLPRRKPTDWRFPGHVSQRIPMYVDRSDVRPAGGHEGGPAGLHRFREVPEARRLHPDAVFGILASCAQQGERRGPHRADQGESSPGWGSADHLRHRQAVRADERILGKIPQTARETAVSVAVFLTAGSPQAVALAQVRPGLSVSDPGP